jgi:ATP-binding cassette subfamily B protein/subfamily B ATP-binding cassette protein MsbA
LVKASARVGVRAIFTRFWPDTRTFRGRFLIGLLLVGVAPVLSTAELWLFKILIDQVVVPRELHLFPVIAGSYVGLAVIQGLVSFSDQYLSTWVGERFVLDLRSRLFAHLHQLSSGFFEHRPLGDVLSRLTGDIGAIEDLVLSGVAQTVTYLLQMVLFTGALFYLDWRLAGVALLAAPGFLLAARFFSRRIKDASREKRRRAGALTSVAEESFANSALVRAYDRAKQEGERFHEQNLAAFSAQMLATRLQALFRPLTDLLEVFGVLLVIGLAVWELTNQRITIGGLLAFVAYLTRLYSPIQGLGRLTNSLYAASASAERVIELLDEKPAVTDPVTPRPLRNAQGTVHFDNVSFTYPGTATPALAGIDFTAAPGTKIAVVGASGAGKSTLAKLLLRFYDPDTGAVTLDGVDVRELALGDLYRNVATVLQETLVFDGTIRDNILWGRPEASDAAIVAAAQEADAHEFILALPEGYDTRIGQRGRMLSGGQRQRLAIARAMIRDAPILLLDEPTTGLDADSARRVLAPLRRLMAGRTTIIISHNLVTVTDADTILFLDHGHLIGTGSHPELLESIPAYAHLFRLHQHPTTNPPHLPIASPPRAAPGHSPNPELPGLGAGTDLELDGVRYRYPGQSLDTIPEVNLRVPVRGSLAVIGPPGSGKSTLLSLLTRVTEPSSGTIRLGGRALREFGPAELRARVALVPQDPWLLHGSIAQNIQAGQRDATPAQIEAAAQAAGAHGFIAALPEAYSTRLGANRPSLPTEQVRRIALARALLGDPGILLLDEPTAGLDQHERNDLLGTLCLLTTQRTTIVTTRDPVVAALTDHITHLDQCEPDQWLAQALSHRRTYEDATPDPDLGTV